MNNAAAVKGYLWYSNAVTFSLNTSPWSGRGHSAGKTCPLQQGFCSPPYSFFNKSTLHPLRTPTTTSSFFFLNPIACCLQFYTGHTGWSFETLAIKIVCSEHQRNQLRAHFCQLILRRTWIGLIKTLTWKSLFSLLVFPNIANISISL